MSDLLVAAPLRLEALAIKAGGRKLRIQKTGMGPARSHAAIPRLRSDPAAALAVMGVCGGLDDHCEPGDVVVADELLDGERDDPSNITGVGRSSRALDAGQPVRLACPSAGPLAEALQRRGISVRKAAVVSVAHIAHGEKRVELRERGGVVVDMESAWLAGGAQGRPFAVIRVVADTPSRSTEASWRSRRPSMWIAHAKYGLGLKSASLRSRRIALVHRYTKRLRLISSAAIT